MVGGLEGKLMEAMKTKQEDNQQIPLPQLTATL